MSQSVDPHDKQVFTTGDVAKFTHTAPRTVSKWVDSGLLSGYRVPGSQDRRIPRDPLLDFLIEHNIPLGRLQKKVLFLSTDEALIDSLTERCRPLKHPPVTNIKQSSFGAGMAFQTLKPDCFVIDLGTVSVSVAETILVAFGNSQNPPYSIALLPDGITAEELDDTLQVDQIFERPFDPELLSETILSQVVVSSDF